MSEIETKQLITELYDILDEEPKLTVLDILEVKNLDFLILKTIIYNIYINSDIGRQLLYQLIAYNMQKNNLYIIHSNSKTILKIPINENIRNLLVKYNDVLVNLYLEKKDLKPFFNDYVKIYVEDKMYDFLCKSYNEYPNLSTAIMNIILESS